MPQYIADRGIRTAPLHIRVDELATFPTNGTPSLILEATESGSSDAPIMQLQRITSSPSDTDDLGRIQFIGNNSAGENISYATIHAESRDVTDGTEDGQIIFAYRNAGNLETAMQLGRDEIVFNEGSNDTNFRVESDDQTHMFFVDAGNNRININSSTDEGGIVNIITTDNSSNLVLACRDTDASSGPTLTFDRDIGISEVSANDLIGRMSFGSASNQYAEIQTKVLDPTVGSKDGELAINVESNDTMRNVLRLGATEAVFNDDSQNIDFRIEADTQENMFFVDAENGRIGIRRNDPQLAFDVTGSGRFSQGVLFGTDTASANLLDDYEEGTFVPSCTFSSADPTAGARLGEGRYVKIGSLVTVQVRINNVLKDGASGDIQINNMPFTSKADGGDGQIGEFTGSCSVNSVNYAGSTFLTAGILDNTSRMRITENTDNTVRDILTAGNFTHNSSDIFASVTYQSA